MPKKSRPSAQKIIAALTALTTAIIAITALIVALQGLFKAILPAQPDATASPTVPAQTSITPLATAIASVPATISTPGSAGILTPTSIVSAQ
jgi:hypothetical protein